MKYKTWLEALVIKAQKDWHLNDHLPDKYSKIEGENETVLREVRHDCDGHIFKQLVIPSQAKLLCWMIIKLLHGATHAGVDQLVSKFKQVFHFQGVKRLARDIVANCRICNLHH